MTRRAVIVVALVACGCTLAGCDLSMTEQRKLTTYAPTSLWPDGTSARPLPDNVVAQGDVERAAAAKTPPPVTADAAGARPRALRHLLRAVPWPCGRWRRRHRRPRFSGAAVLSHRSARRGAGAAFLRCDDRRLRRDVFLCGSRRSARPLGRSPPISARCSCRAAPPSPKFPMQASASNDPAAPPT